MNCHLGGAIPHTGGSQKRASGAASAKYSHGFFNLQNVKGEYYKIERR